MQSSASIGRAVYRITFRRGSPQRIHFSPALTGWALLALVLLATAGQVLVFGGDLIDVVLYLFTWLCGLAMGIALLSRRVPRGRLRSSQQAAVLILAAAHALLLAAAPFSGTVPWLSFAVASALAVAVALGFVNSVQYALAAPRSKALALTLAFLFALAAFYATMRSLLAIALA